MPAVWLEFAVCSVLGRRLCDSGPAVLMSGHFGLQLLCHLTSQLFYRKGHFMHSYTKATCVHISLSTRTHAPDAPRVISQNAPAHLKGFIPGLHAHIYHTLPPDFIRNTTRCVCCTETCAILSPGWSSLIYHVN